MSDFPSSSSHWEVRGIAASMMFVGILMCGGGFWAALVVSVMLLPLATLNFTWTIISSSATLVFIVGLARICGWHLLP